jgi:hypothetical protein
MGHCGTEVEVSQPTCCFCFVSMDIQARAHGSSIVRGWVCPECHLEVKGDRDVPADEAVAVIASLNVLDAKIDD